MHSHRIKMLIAACIMTALIVGGNAHSARAETGPGVQKKAPGAMNVWREDVVFRLAWTPALSQPTTAPPPAAAPGSTDGVEPDVRPRPRPGRGLVLAGKWMVGVGTPVAVIGAILIPIGAIASSVAGGIMFYGGLAMLTAGGVAAITGIALWAVGVRRNRLARSWRQSPVDTETSRFAARRAQRLPQVWTVASHSVRF